MSREHWLQLFLCESKTHFERVEAPFPNNIRVSVGFTSRGSRGSAVGECWPAELSHDATFEIFISPTESDAAQVASILTHELIHAAVGLEAKHGAPFKRVAHALGLQGAMSATEPGDRWFEWAQPILDKIGAFPHSALSVESTRIKQSTRLVKSTCKRCGFLFRSSRKWLENCTLRCPDSACNGLMETAANLDHASIVKRG